MKRRQWVMATGVLAWCVTAADARISAHSPALAVRTTGSTFLALSVTGEGFGTPEPGARVHVTGVRSEAPVALDIPSTDSSLFVWRDVQVVLKLPADLHRARISVIRASGRTPRVLARYYAHDSFDTTATGDLHSPPTHTAIDPAGRLCVNPAFTPTRLF